MAYLAKKKHTTLYGKATCTITDEKENENYIDYSYEYYYPVKNEPDDLPDLKIDITYVYDSKGNKIKNYNEDVYAQECEKHFFDEVVQNIEIDTPDIERD